MIQQEGKRKKYKQKWGIYTQRNAWITKQQEGIRKREQKTQEEGRIRSNTSGRFKLWDFFLLSSTMVSSMDFPAMN